MHSRIFKLTTNPDQEPDFTIFDVPEWFTSEIADCTDESDLEKDRVFLDGLFDDNPHMTLVENRTDDGRVYYEWHILDVEKAQQAYFRERFNAFKEQAENISLADFSNGDRITYLLRRSILDCFDVYISIDNDLMPLDDFMRGLARYDAVLYVVASLDYHY